MIRIVNDADELHSLREQWNELADLQRNVLLRHEWIVSAACTFFSAEQRCFFIYSENGRIDAIAPLVKIGSGLGARLLLIGFLYLYEPADFLYRDKAALEKLMREVARQRIPVIFQRIPLDSPVLDFGCWKIAGVISGTRVHYPSNSQFLDISTGWNEFYLSLTAKNRNDLGRAAGKAARAGQVSFEFISVDRETNARYLAEFLQLEKQSWKARSGTAISSTKSLRSFFDSFTSLGSESEGFYYAHMKIDGKLVAAQMFRIQYGRLWILKIAHAEDSKFCSPGVLLMQEVVRFAFEEGVGGIEFLGFSERWLKKWSTGYRRQVDFSYFPLSLISVGRLFLGVKARVASKLKR
jgi:hypothetical protein